MNPQDDWGRWGDDWLQQPTVDVARLRRRVQRKRWQMRVMVGIEMALALFAVGQLVRLLLMPGVTERWKIWAGLAFLLMAATVYLALRARRGTWRSATEDIPGLLRLTAERARAGIRLAWMNILSVPVLLAISLLMPGVTERWKIWAGLAFLLMAATVYLALRARRGTWRSATEDIPGLLRLTAERARAGIRLAWMNILSVPVLLAISLPIAAPWLAPSRWRHDPVLQRVLLFQLVINGVVIGAVLVFFVAYIRRQRRRLREVEALLREYAD